jgi:hypothetical protein
MIKKETEAYEAQDRLNIVEIIIGPEPTWKMQSFFKGSYNINPKI